MITLGQSRSAQFEMIDRGIDMSTVLVKIIALHIWRDPGSRTEEEQAAQNEDPGISDLSETVSRYVRVRGWVT